jgi:lipoyl(octanoyl) transferase
MAVDEALLEWASRGGRPVLRFYRWSEAAASFGYFQKYRDVETLTDLRPLIRRPTGGGLVPHAADWTYSLAFPATHGWYCLKAVESYRKLHEWVQRSLAGIGWETQFAPEPLKEGPGQCFLGAERDDLLWRGKKIAGAAQRRLRDGLLIQGSLQPPPEWNRGSWEEAFRWSGRSLLAASWEPFPWEEAFDKRVEELRERKYGRADFNQRR